MFNIIFVKSTAMKVGGFFLCNHAVLQPIVKVKLTTDGRLLLLKFHSLSQKNMQLRWESVRISITKLVWQTVPKWLHVYHTMKTQYEVISENNYLFNCLIWAMATAKVHVKPLVHIPYVFLSEWVSTLSLRTLVKSLYR